LSSRGITWVSMIVTAKSWKCAMRVGNLHTLCVGGIQATRISSSQDQMPPSSTSLTIDCSWMRSGRRRSVDSVPEPVAWSIPEPVGWSIRHYELQLSPPVRLHLRESARPTLSRGSGAFLTCTPSADHFRKWQPLGLPCPVPLQRSYFEPLALAYLGLPGSLPVIPQPSALKMALRAYIA